MTRLVAQTLSSPKNVTSIAYLSLTPMALLVLKCRCSPLTDQSLQFAYRYLFSQSLHWVSESSFYGHFQNSPFHFQPGTNNRSSKGVSQSILPHLLFSEVKNGQRKSRYSSKRILLHIMYMLYSVL